MCPNHVDVNMHHVTVALINPTVLREYERLYPGPRRIYNLDTFKNDSRDFSFKRRE